MSKHNRHARIPDDVVIRHGALEDLPRLLENLDSRECSLITGPGFSREVAERVLDAYLPRSASHLMLGQKEGLSELERIVQELPGNTTVIGLGGGRPIDVAKAASKLIDAPCITVPTALSHDGIGSPVGSLRNTHGNRVSFGVSMPHAIVIDLDVVGTAPNFMTRAGVGDLLSNLTAVADWALAARLGHEHYDEYSATIALQAANAISGPLDPQLTDARFLELLARSLVMSGLAMEVAGTSRPASGSEHLISHALDELLGSNAKPHGIQVALGLLVAARAHGIESDLKLTFKRLGLPTHPEQVGIDLQQMVRATAMAPLTRPDRFTILSQVDSEAQIAQLVHDSFVS